MKKEIRRYALENAVRYGKPPRVDAVLKRVLGEHPELRKDARRVARLVADEIKDIESKGLDEWNAELRLITPEMTGTSTKRESREETKLPELPLSGHDKKVVMRFAPNPNGAATLGSARGIVINSEYAKMYKGKLSSGLTIPTRC